MMLIRVTDFETTGLPDEGGKICEVGWTDLDWDPLSMTGELRDTVSRLVNPGVPITLEAMAVHHITNEMLAAEPPVEEWMGEPEGIEYWAAHNAQFEQALWEFPAPVICTWKVACRLFPEAPAHSNQVLRYYLGLKVDEGRGMPPHRAGPDSYVTALLLVRLLQTGTSVEEMVRWSSGPCLMPRVPFGKHKGAVWSSVPDDYLWWIVDRMDPKKDVDVIANAKHHLKARAATRRGPGLAPMGKG